MNHPAGPEQPSLSPSEEADSASTATAPTAPRPQSPAPQRAPIEGPPLTKSLAAAMRRCLSLLIPGEYIVAWSPQIRISALFHRRIILVATTGRLLEFRRGFFGGYDLFGIRWQDIERVEVRSNVFSSRLLVRAFDMPDFTTADLSPNARILQYVFNGFDRNSCAAVYRMIQTNEQSWREKRRTRQIEEMRAKSGGFQVGNGSGFGGGKQMVHESSPGVAMTPSERISQAKDMLDKGLISDSEFETIKARIVGEL